MISYTYTKETRKTKRGTLASKMFKKKTNYIFDY